VAGKKMEEGAIAYKLDSKSAIASFPQNNSISFSSNLLAKFFKEKPWLASSNSNLLLRQV
jgi:hypothetical protein